MLEYKYKRTKSNEKRTFIARMLDFLEPFCLLFMSLASIASIIAGIWMGIGCGVFGFLFIFTYIGGMGIVMLTMTMAWASDWYAKYEIKADGLYIKYPLEPVGKISWEEFQVVCVCHAHFNYGSGTAAPIICCVKKGEKRSWFSGRWKTENPYKYRSVIQIAYTDEVYEEFKQNCPYPVPDLRNTRRYKIYK